MNRIPLTISLPVSRHIIFIISSILLFSCKDKSVINYSLPDSNDIEKIIETIIMDDSIPVLKYDAAPDTLHASDGKSRVVIPIKHPFNIDLEKMKILFSLPQKDKDMELTPPLPFHCIYFKDIVHEEEQMFTTNDSAYVSYQNDSLNRFLIKGNIRNKIYITTSEKQAGKQDAYFSCSIPVFSADKKKAYVELTYNCFGLCSSSNLYLLAKTNTTWKIVKKRTLWIS